MASDPLCTIKGKFNHNWRFVCGTLGTDKEARGLWQCAGCRVIETGRLPTLEELGKGPIYVESIEVPS